MHLTTKVVNQSQPQALWKIHPILIQGCKFFMGNTRCNSALGVKPWRRWAPTADTSKRPNSIGIHVTHFVNLPTIIVQIIQTNITYHLSIHSKYVYMAKQNLLLKINAFYKAEFVWLWFHCGKSGRPACEASVGMSLRRVQRLAKDQAWAISCSDSNDT